MFAINAKLRWNWNTWRAERLRAVRGTRHDMVGRFRSNATTMEMSITKSESFTARTDFAFSQLIHIADYYYYYLLQGTYRINDGKFDLTTIRRLPINPEKLNVNLTLYEYVTDVHKHRNVIKRQLICLESKVTITLSKTSSVTTHTSPSRRRNGARPP